VKKGGIDASRIANDPAFQRTVKMVLNLEEQARPEKVLRTALRVLNSADGRMRCPTHSSDGKIIQADTSS
jgi:hypothetical protein